MAKDLVFKLVVSNGGKEAYSANLSYEAVSSIASGFSDNSDSNDFFLLAAQHPASSVRENVAYKDQLSTEVVELLSKDNSIAVLRNLVRSSAFRSFATQELLEKLIQLDTEVAQSIANNVESFENGDVNKLSTLLANHEDPSVVVSLAQNYSTPKKILKTLSTHSDPYVASEAKARLED